MLYSRKGRRYLAAWAWEKWVGMEWWCLAMAMGLVVAMDLVE